MENTKARALVDIPGQAIKAGEFFTGPDKLVKALVKDGLADDKAQESEVYGAGAIPPAKELAATPEVIAQAEAEAKAKGGGK